MKGLKEKLERSMIECIRESDRIEKCYYYLIFYKIIMSKIDKK